MHIEIAHGLTADSFFKLSQDLFVDGVRRSKFSATTELILWGVRPRSRLLWSSEIPIELEALDKVEL